MIFGRRNPVLVQISAQVVWHVAQDMRDGHWFGVCPALNLNAAGDSFAEFQECANEAIDLLFKSLFQRGELEAFLRRNGWRAKGPLPPAGSNARFDVPFDILQKNRMEELTGTVA